MDDKIPARLRASDDDRERVAATIQAAGAEGRLTLAEVEDRLSTVYATRFTDELGELTTDLPRPQPERRPFVRDALRHPALRVHLGIVVAIAVLLIVRWAVSGAEFFWPAIPMFWLFMSVLAHARVRSLRGAVRRRSGEPVPY
ncbi:DUF1707 domain-containing protein [Amycolatopsis sp. NBC_00345]|uniref:DUF1707 SHOCT-like domain-containing protein n=1 Tax=Amycolatopsis sp. NBC_00345 TaxID=2975955 RepID=UPI002E26DD7B